MRIQFAQRLRREPAKAPDPVAFLPNSVSSAGLVEGMAADFGEPLPAAGSLTSAFAVGAPSARPGRGGSPTRTPGRSRAPAGAGSGR